jgi:hypothetical protein
MPASQPILGAFVGVVNQSSRAPTMSVAYQQQAAAISCLECCSWSQQACWLERCKVPKWRLCNFLQFCQNGPFWGMITASLMHACSWLASKQEVHCHVVYRSQLLVAACSAPWLVGAGFAGRVAAAHHIHCNQASGSQSLEAAMVACCSVKSSQGHVEPGPDGQNPVVTLCWQYSMSPQRGSRPQKTACPK